MLLVAVGGGGVGVEEGLLFIKLVNGIKKLKREFFEGLASGGAVAAGILAGCVVDCDCCMCCCVIDGFNVLCGVVGGCGVVLVVRVLVVRVVGVWGCVWAVVVFVLDFVLPISALPLTCASANPLVASASRSLAIAA